MKGKVSKTLVKSFCAVVAGTVCAAAGCSLGDAMNFARATAIGAVRDQAGQAIEDTVGGVIGGLLPSADGA